MNIIVIGGAGYIGSHIVCDLVDLGHEITVFDSSGVALQDISIAFQIYQEMLESETITTIDLGGLCNSTNLIIIGIAA